MTRTSFSAWAALAVLALTAPAAHAQTFTATLTGSQETPPVTGAPATGNASIVLQSNGSDIFVNLHAANLYTNITGVYFQQAAPGTAGPVVLNLATAAGTGTVNIGQTTVDISKTYIGLAALVAGFQSGLPYYANITASNYPLPNGLIRGNFSPAPEPSPVAALVVGILGLSALAFKSRKRSAA